MLNQKLRCQLDTFLRSVKLNPLESCCVLIVAWRSSSHAADWSGEGNEKYFEPLEVLNLCLYKIASVRTSSNSPNVYPFCCWWFQMKPRSSLWFPLENISPPAHTCMCVYVWNFLEVGAPADLSVSIFQDSFSSCEYTLHIFSSQFSGTWS